MKIEFELSESQQKALEELTQEVKKQNPQLDYIAVARNILVGALIQFRQSQIAKELR